ncbi:MAG: hypothetical protein A2992_06335 [Elusimicrobia bacterium RIFCSPLOWO2_01_FULL_59_12]|nr:MAG: hypothetical protein A2992_06335 [Elusimicrobia bacterium RIFCSPLOWO2_01_FULL_59_12]
MAGFEILFEATDQASPIIEKLSKQMLEAAQRSERFAGDIAVASQKADESLSKIHPKATQAAGSLAALEQASNQLKTQLLGFATVAGITAFFKDSAEAALSEQEALRRLGFAVEATGSSFGSQKDKILAFAKEQQDLTQFSDTQTFEAMGRLVRVTGDVGQAMQATKLAFGLASASGRDFNSIIDLLGPILNGDASRLRALKNEFGAFIGDANTAQEVIEALSKRFLGAAEQQTGYGRELASLRNKLEDFQETVGTGVLPAIQVLLQGVLRGAQAFEYLGLAIASVAALSATHIQGTFQALGKILTGNFSQLPGIVRETTGKFKTILEESEKQATDITKRYSRDRQDVAKEEGDLKAKITKKSIEDTRKEQEEKEKDVRDAHEKVVRLESERLELEKNHVEARRLLVDQEKQDRLRQFDELKEKGLITEQELTQAKVNANEVARLELEKAKQEQIKGLDEVAETAKATGDALASSVGKGVADMILEGKSFESAMTGVFNTVLRTAIETFTRIAIEAAIAREAAEGAAFAGGGGAGFAILGGLALSKGFKFAEGGIVTKPTVGLVGEAGPEAVIPLDRIGGFGKTEVTIQQTNNFTINGGASDEQVKDIMRKISDVTRSGAAEGAEMVKSILSRSDRVSKQSV